jgi:hypothetical protein
MPEFGEFKDGQLNDIRQYLRAGAREWRARGGK